MGSSWLHAQVPQAVCQYETPSNIKWIYGYFSAMSARHKPAVLHAGTGGVPEYEKEALVTFY
jgi:hypothetical protein